MSNSITQLSKKDRREWLSAIFYCQVEKMNNIEQIDSQLDKLENADTDQEFKASMRTILKDRKAVVTKRGKVLDAEYKGIKIQVWQNNEHGWKYKPVVERYIKTPDGELFTVPKFLYDHEYKLINHGS